MFYMRKIFSMLVVVLTIICMSSCKKPDPLKQITNYYNEYSTKLEKADGDEEVQKTIEDAMEDFKNIIYDNKKYFLDLLVHNKYGGVKETDDDIKELTEAWKKCNIILAEKTNRQWEYMPDFLAIMELLEEDLPKDFFENPEPVKSVYDFGQSKVDECEHEDCEHEHNDSVE